MYPIVRREVFSETTFLWEVLAPDIARAALPGHFVMLRLHEGGARGGRETLEDRCSRRRLVRLQAVRKSRQASWRFRIRRPGQTNADSVSGQHGASLRTVEAHTSPHVGDERPRSLKRLKV